MIQPPRQPSFGPPSSRTQLANATISNALRCFGPSDSRARHDCHTRSFTFTATPSPPFRAFSDAFVRPLARTPHPGCNFSNALECITTSTCRTTAIPSFTSETHPHSSATVENVLGLLRQAFGTHCRADAPNQPHSNHHRCRPATSINQRKRSREGLELSWFARLCRMTDVPPSPVFFASPTHPTALLPAAKA